MKSVGEIEIEKAELAALNAILGTLRVLDEDTAIRIIKTALVFYGVKLTAS